MKMFSKLVGQPEVKSQLSFYAQAEKAGSIIPPIMLNGSKGLGKTEFAKHFAVGMGKKLVEINCGSKSKTVNFGESGFATFDFTKQNFLFATTELDKIFAPLKDRMTIVDFQPYTPQDLKYIIKNKKDWIGYDPTVLNEIASSVRGNARSAVKRVLEISSYCNIKKIDFVDKSAWAGLKKILGIRPFGLSNIEVQILKTLSSHGPSSLQMLSAVTGMSRSALQRDAENGLLKDGFMTIEGKRMITPKGRKLLKELV